MIKTILGKHGVIYDRPAIYKDFRAGDVRHSQADIAKIVDALGYQPTYDVFSGLERSMCWYKENVV